MLELSQACISQPFSWNTNNKKSQTIVFQRRREKRWKKRKVYRWQTALPILTHATQIGRGQNNTSNNIYGCWEAPHKVRGTSYAPTLFPTKLIFNLCKKTKLLFIKSVITKKNHSEKPKSSSCFNFIYLFIG